MKKIQILNRYNDSVIYEHECENNTIKTTVEKSIKEKIPLSYANLSNADLSNANLSNANLSNANLYNANLSYANLRSADLYNANLRSADLYNADLSNTDLSNADLYKVRNKELAYLPMFCKWQHSIIGDKIKIGCKEFTIEEWVNFFEKSIEVFSTPRDSQDFKQIKAVFYAYKAYLETLKN
jgi:hypothetical protein